MKFWEVLPLAVEQGKKIRCTNWSARAYIRWKDAADFFADETGMPYELSAADFKDDDWEVIEKNPHEEGIGPWAAWWLERGTD